MNFLSFFFTLFFLLIGKFSIYLFVLLIFIPIRIYSGGIHMKTNITCGIFSLAFLLLGICILPQVILSIKTSFIMLTSAFVIISLCSPFSSPKKPITSKEKYRKYKFISIIFTGIAIGVITFCFYSNRFIYAYPAQWIITLQAMQLLMAHIIKRGRG